MNLIASMREMSERRECDSHSPSTRRHQATELASIYKRCGEVVPTTNWAAFPRPRKSSEHSK